jgi:hypothetical protein
MTKIPALSPWVVYLCQMIFHADKIRFGDDHGFPPMVIIVIFFLNFYLSSLALFPFTQKLNDLALGI